MAVLALAVLLAAHSAAQQGPADLLCDPCASPEAWAALPRQVQMKLAKHLAGLQIARARAAGDRMGEAKFLALDWLAESGTRRLDRSSEGLEKSLEILSEAGESFAAGTVASTLGLYRIARGETAAAEHDLLAAIETFRAVREPVVLEKDGLDGIFLVLLDLPALVVGLASLPSSRPETASQTGEILARSMLGEVFFRSNRLGQAEVQLLRAIELGRSLGAPTDHPAQVALGRVFQAQGRSADSRRAFTEALATLDAGPVYESPERDAMVRLELLMQLAAAAHGDRDRAQATRLAEIEELLPDIEYSEMKARASSLLAGQLAIAGRYEDSLRYGNQASDLWRQLGNADHEETMRTLLGVTYLKLFATDRSTIELERASALARQEHLRDLSQVMLDFLRIREEGIQAAPEAIELLKELGPSGEPFAQAIRDSLLLQETYGETVPAVEMMKVYKQMMQPFGSDQGDWVALADEGIRILESTARLSDASSAGTEREMQLAEQDKQAYLEMLFEATLKMLETARQTGDREQQVRSLRSLAMAQSVRGRDEAALPFLREAVGLIEQMAVETQLDDLTTSLLAEHASVYHQLVTTLSATGRHAEAFASAERARARSLLQLLGRPRSDPHREAEPSLVVEAEAVQARLFDLEARARGASDTASPVALRQQADSVRKELEDLTFRIKLSNPRAADFAQVEPTELPEVQALLAPETTLISFLVTDSQTHAWVITRDHVEPVTIELRREPLVGHVRELRHEIAARTPFPRARDRGVRLLEPGSGSPESAESAGEVLTRTLLAPLLPHVRTRRLLLVPHGVLHDLPFAALRQPETGRFLVEDYELSYAPSASAMRYLELRSGQPEGRALVLGDPEVAENEDLPELGGARREAQRISRFLGVTPRLGAEATETFLREQARGVDVLHVAAHNVPSQSNPRFAYLALAPDEHHDGKLEMREIFEELDLQGVDLVTLSACETALGERTEGDEVMGLTRALLHAGAGSVLATLWSVDDQASATLMILFYARLQAGGSAAQALAEAQRELLASEDTLPPFYWAAFTLVGEPWGGTQKQPAGSH